MQIAIDCASFTPAEADRLRQAMSSKRAPERIEELRARLLDGMAARGIPAGGRRGHLRQDPGLLQLRLPRVARDQLRLPGLRQRLAEVLLPGRVHRRPAARPADGLLRPGQPDQRRAQARRARSAASTSTPATCSRPSKSPHFNAAIETASPRRSRHPADPAIRGPRVRASRRSGLACPRCATWARRPTPPSWPASRTGIWRTSPAAPGCRSRRLRHWPPRARSAASGSAGARRCGRPGRRPRSGPAAARDHARAGRAAAAGDDGGRGDLRRPVGDRDLRHPPVEHIRALLAEHGVIAGGGAANSPAGRERDGSAGWSRTGSSRGRPAGWCS